MDKRTHPNDVVTPRRSFFTRIAASAMAVGHGLDLRQRAAAGADDEPDWPGTQGTAPSGGGCLRGERWFSARVCLYVRGDKRTSERGVVPATAVVVLRHTAFPLALDHTMWQKYKIGQSLSILDPETKAPAVKNPFLQPKPGVLTVDEMAIDRVLADGAVIGACNIALKVLSGKLAQNAGVSAEEAAKEWAANIIPGITVIPSGTWGLNRAQEHGCTYCAGG
jgi:hypothetical protein